MEEKINQTQGVGRDVPSDTTVRPSTSTASSESVGSMPAGSYTTSHYGETGSGTTGDPYGGVGMSNEGSHMRDMVEQAADRLELRRRVREHPYAAIATAAAVGYLLGGGRMMVLFGFGLRAAFMPFVREQVKRIAQTSFSGGNASHA